MDLTDRELNPVLVDRETDDVDPEHQGRVQGPRCNGMGFEEWENGDRKRGGATKRTQGS